MRHATISVIATGNKPANLDTIFAVLAALDLEFRNGERSKRTYRDIEDLS